jgi:uncharacterized membrane protein YraQ (UPF0718 family)
VPPFLLRVMNDRIKDVLENSWKQIKGIFPLFFLAVAVSTVIDFYMPHEIVYSVLGKNLLVAIPLAAFLGIILPIPRYVTYPIAYTLYLKGASLSVIFSLISGEVIVGSPDRDVMEFKFFGAKSYFLRMFLCTIFVILGGYAMELIF